jgi:hypothetical protein
MNTLSSLILLGCVLACAGCSKSYEPPTEEAFLRHSRAMAPPVAPCTDCKWDSVAGKEGPVSYLACTGSDGEPAHCHVKVMASEPKRTGLVTKVGTRYSLEVKTDGKKDEGIVCEDLALAPNPVIIYTKEKLCVFREPGLQGGEEHHLGAKLEKLADGKFLIRFVFQHEPFSKKGDPIHNGEGHIHLPN